MSNKCRFEQRNFVAFGIIGGKAKAIVQNTMVISLPTLPSIIDWQKEGFSEAKRACLGQDHFLGARSTVPTLKYRAVAKQNPTPI